MKGALSFTPISDHFVVFTNFYKLNRKVNMEDVGGERSEPIFYKICVKRALKRSKTEKYVMASENFSEIAFKMFYKHYFRGTSMHPLKRVCVHDRSQNISKGGAKS